MNYRGAITTDIGRLLDLFGPYCHDRETLDWLRDATADQSKWRDAHRVFDHIRSKYLKSERKGDGSAAAQYLFEEICAKTLYNLSKSPAPFDPDSPYWVLPNAFSLAKWLGVSDTTVLGCISLQGVNHGA